MAEPIIEQIAVNVVAAINQITGANGFNQTLKATRPIRLGFEDGEGQKDLTVLVVQRDPEEDPESSTEGNPAAKAWMQPFLCIAYVIDSDSSTTPIDTRKNRIRSDIEKKLREDPERGGNAWDTQIRAPESFNLGPSATGISVVVEVFYKTSEDNPDVVRQ